MNNTIWDAALWLRKKLNRDKEDIVAAVNSIQNLFATSADATASPSDILEGQTAYNGTVLITGNMRDIRGTTVTTETVTQDENYTYLSVPEGGCYGTDSKIRTKNSNIKIPVELELIEGTCMPGDVIDLKKQIVAIAIAYDRKSMFISTTFRALSLGNLYRYPSANNVVIDGTKATLTYSGGTAAGGGTGDTDPADYYMALVVK